MAKKRRKPKVRLVVRSLMPTLPYYDFVFKPTNMPAVMNPWDSSTIFSSRKEAREAGRKVMEALQGADWVG